MKKDKDEINIIDIDDDVNQITFTDNLDDLAAEENNGEIVQIESESAPKKPKKKKKRRKKRYLLKFFILIVVILAVFLFLRSSFFSIDAISVTNNKHYTEGQILKIADIKNGDNLFAFRTSSLKKKLTKDPYINKAEIKRSLPNKLSININERMEKVAIPNGDNFVVADYDGMVLRATKEVPDLTIIENLEIKKAKPGTALEVSETQILTDSLNLLKKVEKEGLYFKKISVSHLFVKGYVYDNLVFEGAYDSISDNMDNIAVVMEHLNKNKITRGTVKVSANGHCVHQPEVDSGKADKKKTTDS